MLTFVQVYRTINKVIYRIKVLNEQIKSKGSIYLKLKALLTKVNLKASAPDLALAQENKVLKEKNKKLEKDLFEHRLLFLEHKAETDAKLEEARIREENMARSLAEMKQKQEETNDLLKRFLKTPSNKPTLSCTSFMFVVFFSLFYY